MKRTYGMTISNSKFTPQIKSLSRRIDILYCTCECKEAYNRLEGYNLLDEESNGSHSVRNSHPACWTGLPRFTVGLGLSVITAIFSDGKRYIVKYWIARKMESYLRIIVIKNRNKKLRYLKLVSLYLFYEIE